MGYSLLWAATPELEHSYVIPAEENLLPGISHRPSTHLKLFCSSITPTTWKQPSPIYNSGLLAAGELWALQKLLRTGWRQSYICFYSASSSSNTNQRSTDDLKGKQTQPTIIPPPENSIWSVLWYIRRLWGGYFLHASFISLQVKEVICNAGSPSHKFQYRCMYKMTDELNGLRRFWSDTPLVLYCTRRKPWQRTLVLGVYSVKFPVFVSWSQLSSNVTVFLVLRRTDVTLENRFNNWL